MRTCLLPLLAALSLSPACLAQAPPPAARFREVFLQLDANADTVLERDEIPESGRSAFDRLLKGGDANGDGKLQADEMRALGQKLAALNDPQAVERRFKGMDKDGDGKVSRAEFTGVPANFDRIDADRDGAITTAEARKSFAAPAQAARPKANAKKADKADKAEAKKDGDSDEKTPEAKKKEADAPRAGPAPAIRRFKTLDKDGDGTLSREEFPRPKVFNRLDADKDGKLTPAEWAKLRPEA